MRRSPEAAARVLRELDGAGLRRVRRRVDEYPADGLSTRVQVGDRRLVNFCSNDYLGLARDPRLAAAMARAAGNWGAGAGAAHLVTGHTAEHHALEEELAAFTGREAALLFSTGYMANLGAICALADRNEIVAQDRLNHASLLDGARLAGARLQRYAHADAIDARRLLQQAGAAATLLVTDGVFSMDGDIAPLRELAAAAAANATWFMVDDAHGLGAVGATGRGTLELAGLDAAQVPVLVGTFGKALGCFGAFVAGDADVVELILQRARSYIYTTALPPAVAAAVRMALTIVDAESWRRERLQALIARFRTGAAQRGLPLTASTTAIQPLVMGDNARCLAASQALAARGYWVAAMRRPTVPAGTERLRVNLSAAHTEAEIDGLLDALDEALCADGLADARASPP
jgi:8-amino-7-oxononanoate synthase